MTDLQLTALGTVAWLIGTAMLFILLARWSAGGTWGIANAVVRGLTGWVGGEASAGARSPSGGELRPMQTPRLDRLWGSHLGQAAAAAMTPAAEIADPAPMAEVKGLGGRRRDR